MDYELFEPLVVLLTIFLTESFILYMVTRLLKFKKQDLKTALKTIFVSLVGMFGLIFLLEFISFRYWFGLSKLMTGNFYLPSLLILLLVFLLYLIKRFYSVGWNDAFSALSMWFTIVFVLTTLLVVLVGLPVLTLANYIAEVDPDFWRQG